MNDERHPTARTLERLLAAVHLGTRAHLRAIVLEVYSRVGSPDLASFFEAAAENLAPVDPLEREFILRFAHSAARLQVRSLLDGAEGKPLRIDQYEELITLMQDTHVNEAHGIGFLFLRDEYLSQVDLKKIWSGMKGTEHEIFWRWLRAAEEADRENELDPTDLLDAPELFEPVLRRAMTPSEYRATFVEPQTRPMKELHKLLQGIVRDGLSRIWNFAAVD